MTHYILDRLLFALTILIGMFGLTMAVFGYGGTWQPVLLGFRTGELYWATARGEYESFYHQAGWLTCIASIIAMLAIFALRQQLARTPTRVRRDRFTD